MNDQPIRIPLHTGFRSMAPSPAPVPGILPFVSFDLTGTDVLDIPQSNDVDWGVRENVIRADAVKAPLGNATSFVVNFSGVTAAAATVRFQVNRRYGASLEEMFVLSLVTGVAGQFDWPLLTVAGWPFDGWVVKAQSDAPCFIRLSAWSSWGTCQPRWQVGTGFIPLTGVTVLKSPT